VKGIFVQSTQKKVIQGREKHR